MSNVSPKNSHGMREIDPVCWEKSTRGKKQRLTVDSHIG